MKKQILFLLFTFLTLTTFAQTKKNIIEETFDNIKNNSKVDKSDSTCLKLTQKMYEEALQNEISELSNSTIDEIKKFENSRKSKNTYLFSALMFYQEVITKSAKEKKLKPELQRDLINYLEKEFLYVYNKVPTIVYVYKVNKDTARNTVVNIIDRINNLALIKEGVKEGESVIAAGTGTLKNGTPVKPQPTTTDEIVKSIKPKF